MAYSPNFQWKRKTVTITGTSALPAGYQIKIIIPLQTGMQSDFRDLRFETTNGYGLSYWLESKTDGVTSTVWIKLKDAVNASTSVDIYMYYGNPYVTNAGNFNNTLTQPDSISGLKLWLKADIIAGVDGTSIGTWSDISGNGNNAIQATTSRQPTYKVNIFNGKPALRFTASASQTINVNTNFPAPFTVLYIARQNGPTRGRVLSGANNNWLLGWWNGAKRQAYFDGWISPVGSPAADSNVYIYSATGTGSLSTIYENGSQIFSNSSGLSGPNGIAIGYLGGSEFSDVDIAEIIIYDSSLSITDRGKIEKNLAAKYGISVTDYISPVPTTTISTTVTTTNWNPQRKKITINTTTTTPANYQVKFTIPFSPEMNIDFSDIRFVTKTGTVLDYWIESSIPGVIADVWVKLADVINASSSDYIYLHYGNPNFSSMSNGVNTFDFFDHFDGTSLNTEVWTWSAAPGTIYGTATLSVSNSILTLTGGLNTNWILRADKVIKSSFPFIIEYYAKTSESISNHASIIGASDFQTDAWGRNVVAIGDEGVPGKLYRSQENGVTTNNARTTTLTSYTKIKIAERSGGVDFYENNTLTQTITTNSPEVAMGAWMYVAQSPGIVYVDLVFIRKYITTEPTADMTAAAEGGIISVKDGYRFHTFTSNGTFTTKKAMNVEVYTWGGGGAGGTAGGWVYGSAGGAGGAANGLLSANGTYNIVVGGGGIINSYPTGAVGGGGVASTNNIDNRYGGGGGGYSGIFTSAISQANTLIIAGGGGGGGSSRAGTGNAGGAGGGTTGQIGFSAYDGKTSYGGNPGTQSAAGADASCDSANKVGGQGALQGGTARINCYGGAGGGGYWGGSAGGYSEPNTMGGGGGGSAYYNPTYVSSATLTIGSGTTPGDSGNSLRGSAGNAGTVAGNGSSGIVIIRYPLSEDIYVTSADAMNIFSRRKKITINNNSGGALTDYQVPITVTYANTMQPNFNDIRFLDTNGNLLPYWIESKTDNITANVWIKVNLPNYGTSPVGDNIVYMYFGNQFIISASNYFNTFDILGNGSNGALTVSSTNTVINNYTYLTGTENSGDNVIAVNSGTGFSNGDDILIIQMKDVSGNSAGNYEFKKISSGEGTNTFTLNTPLKNNYTSVTQVVRIPQYTSVTINSGASITASAWDGNKGGIVAFRVSGTLNVVGSISVNDKGFLNGETYKGNTMYGGGGGGGGGGYDSGSGYGGYVEGTGGTTGGLGGTHGATGPAGQGGNGGNGGGTNRGSGGVGNTTPGANCGGGGGGGGGGGNFYGLGGLGGGRGGRGACATGTAGANGGSTSGSNGGGGNGGGGYATNGTGGKGDSGELTFYGTDGTTAGGGNGGGGYGGGGNSYWACGGGGGAAGLSYGSADLSTIFLGTSGGNVLPNTGAGGIIIVFAGAIIVTGTVSSNGSNANGQIGGSSGGSVYLTSNNITIGSSLVSARGGTGISTFGGGGAGGDGRIRISANSLLGTSTPSAYTTGFDTTHNRKYVYLEPTVMIGQEEHSRKGGTIIY